MGTKHIDPWLDVASPVFRYQVKHGGAWLAFEFNRLYVFEAVEELVRSGGVTKGDCDVLACQRVEVVPVATDGGD